MSVQARKQRRTNDELLSQIRDEYHKGIPHVSRFLLDAIRGALFAGDQQLDQKTGKLVDKRPTGSVRVLACRVWKELFVDKLIPNKKDTQKHDYAYDLTKDIEAVAAARESKRNKMEAGESKVVKLHVGENRP